uniref:Uncharacterized protein n=1 Tax=Phaseolus vulgaris TaxID=3885 RepID=V7AZJ9_PHAVU|nr:hypothetical protein PHAVU_009G177100g [Phaseolus vulgaris]ESW10053.1 hypothetical protein PHAVU_009G177100g [Phaseolus vulgaris]
MDIDTLVKESFVPQPLQESCTKDMIPLGNPSSHQLLQEHFHHIDEFQFSVPSSINSTFHAFHNFTFTPSSPNLDVYECKPFVMDNFLYGNSQRNIELDIMVSNQSFLPFTPQQIKHSNFALPDELSCISSMNYYKGIGVNKNHRSYPTTRRTYKVHKKSNTVKGHWTIEEDGILIQLVEQYGLRKWSHIAKILPERIGKQCRERWHNHLRPDIKKDTWNCEEDKILIEAHAKIGNKWAEIAKRLPGRTENSIKNHWNATKRRQYSKRKCRSKYPRGTLLQEYIKSLNLDKNPPRDYRRKSCVNYATPMNIKTSTSKATAPALPQTVFQFCATECLAPNSDFNVVPDFLFGENLFEEGCCIDSLLDGVPCVPLENNKIFEGKMQFDGMMEGIKHCDYGGIECVAGVNMDENDVERDMALEMLKVEVKNELDLVEMISQINNETFYV